MSVRVRRSEWCLGDLEHYAAWYDREAGWELAQRYLRAVATSIEHLAENPEIGRRTHFSALELRDLRCWPVERPFQKHLILYRYDGTAVSIERVVHGARDLALRLTEAPDI